MGYDGSDDYFNLFAPNTPWTTAASHTQVFKIYGSWVANYATDEELRRAISGISSRGLALALEFGPFLATSECGSGIEGFDGTLDTVRRIQRAGGTLQFVAFDEPFAFGHVAEGPNTCRWSIERAAMEAATFVRSLHQIAPGVIVGDIEPMWAEISADDLASWLDTYREAAGEPLAFLHLDIDWGRSDWPDALLATEKAARARGVPVGVIYNGGAADSDVRWNDFAAARMYTYEGMTGGRPDQVILQSWMDHPDRVLPESDPSTFTGLILRYFGARTTVKLGEPVPAGPGLYDLGGTLQTTDGGPVADARLAVAAAPLDGPCQVLRLDGLVPPGATSAVVGIRVNTEGAGPGEADLTISDVSYTEGASTSSRVPNGRFEARLEGWDGGGEGAATTPPSNCGYGRMLRLVALPSDLFNFNSGEFAVKPGAAYHFSVATRIPDSSAQSAYIAVIFLHGTEIARHRLALAPAPVDLGEIVTNEVGRFDITLSDMDTGRYRLRLNFAGDLSHWPSFIEQELVPK